MKIVFWLLLIIAQPNFWSSLLSASYADKYVIGSYGNIGLFSDFWISIHKAEWCEQNNKIPIIMWGPRSAYYDPKQPIKNVWEYYFEPLSTAKYMPGDPIHSEYYASPRHRPIQSPEFPPYRIWFNNLIQRRLKIKPHIMQKEKEFFLGNMDNKKIIGVHFRATDKYTERPHIPIEEYIKVLNNFPNHYFLIATDDAHALQQFKTVFGTRVMYYDAYRSLNNKPLHLTSHPVSKYRLGEDVLIEALLLSRCEYLVHTCSNVAYMVLFFNTSVKSIMLSKERPESPTQIAYY